MGYGFAAALPVAYSCRLRIRDGKFFRNSACFVRAELSPWSACSSRPTNGLMP
jgi:hypothetical protein